MSVSLARVDRARVERKSESPALPSVKKTDAKRLRIGAVGDALEREADRVADRVMRGGRMPEWSFAKAGSGRIQRQPTPGAGDQNAASQDAASQDTASQGAAGQQAPQPNNYKDAAGKLGEAFLQTDVGKKLKDAVTSDPLVKGAEDFVGTLPGKIVVGAAATAAVSTLAATHKALPVQIPEIPLDVVARGLKVKVTYEGPVDHPTKAMIGFSYTPGGDKKKKEPSASQRYLAETAPIAASMDEIRAGMRYAPGTPQAEQEAADKKMFAEAMARRFGTLPGTGGRPLAPANGAGQAGAGGAGWTFSPLAHPEQDKKLDLKPAGSSTDATLQRKCACEGSGEQCEECSKKSESLQRKAAGPAEDFAPPIVDEVLSTAGSPLDKATRDDLEPRFGFDFSRVRVHNDGPAAESARAVSALAYTVGDHIVFGAGRFDPASYAGRQLLAHELAHVTQQQGAKGSLVQRQNGPVEVGPQQTDECEGRADITKEFKDFLAALPGLLQSAQDFTPDQKVSFQNEVDRFLHADGVNVGAFKVIACDKINSDLMVAGETASAEVDPNKKEIRLSKKTKKLMDDFKQNKDKASLAKLIETLAHEKRHVTLGSALKADPKAVLPGRPETVADKAEYRAQEILAVAEEIAVGRSAFGHSFAVAESKQEKLRRQSNMIRGYVTEAEYKRLRAIIIAKLRQRYGFTHNCDNALTLGVVSSMDHNRWFECVNGAPGGIVPPVPSDLHICDDFCKTQPHQPGPTENEEDMNPSASAPR